MQKRENSEPIFVAILAGGTSSRMGTDKASLIRNGETLLARTVRLTRTVSDLPPLIVGRDLPDDWGNVAARFVRDDSPGIGPIGGLKTALRHAGNLPIVALSCDLPALTEEALEWLVGQPRGMYGTVTRNGEHLEPLFAIYYAACLPLIAANVSAGKRSLHALMQAGGNGFAYADASPELIPALANVNTPEQWAAFRAR